MKRIFFLFILVFAVSFFVIAQPAAITQITAEGQARIKVQPDRVSYTLTVEKTDSIQKNSISLLNEMTRRVTNMLEQIGFASSEIKIGDYRVYGGYYDVERKQKRYTASNTIKLDFAINYKIIDALYNRLQDEQFSDITVFFQTRLSDTLEKKIRSRLTALSIQDAKDNGADIVRNLGLKITRISRVFRNNPSVPVYAGAGMMMKAMSATADASNSVFDQFKVEDLEMEDRITIVYEAR